MAFPTIGALATRVYEQVSKTQKPGDDETAGWPLAKIVGAYLDPLQWIADALTPDDDHPAGGKLLNPTLTPSGWIDWLAQFHGVRTTKGASDTIRRDEARTAAGRKRGRPASIVATMQRTLTGTRFVAIVQFVDENRWRAAVRTLPAETPDPAITLRAAMLQKPYGIVLRHVVSDSPLWDEVAAAITWDDIDNAVTFDSVTLEDVEA